MTNKSIYCVKDFRGTLPEIADHFGVSYQTLVDRLKSGRTLEEAVSKERMPSRTNTYTLRGYTDTLPQVVRHFNVSYHTVTKRLRGYGH